MTLLASVASIFCSLTLGAAAPSVAIVPAENVVKAVIISPSFDSDGFADVQSEIAEDLGDVSDTAADLSEASAEGADKIALASEDDFLPADVFTEEDDLLPADVIALGDDEVLPADVFVDAELEEILPADVVSDSELEADSALSVALNDVDGLPLAEVEAEIDEASSDREPGEPPPSGFEQVDFGDDTSADGEAAS
jgi:hypothetical protein